MIYECNVFCSTMSEDEAELMGVDDKGTWLPFAFNIDIVVAIKLSSLDEGHLAFGCTTIYQEDGVPYIIDIPFDKFKKEWIQYSNSTEQDLIL